MNFSINELKYDEKHTASIEVHYYRLKKRHPLRKLPYTNGANWHDALYKKSITINKEAIIKLFGKQQLVKDYTYRNWIWTFSNGPATIWILVSKTGIHWEYDTRTNIESCLELTNNVREYIITH